MSQIFTITTELKLNREYNQLVGKYISDYIGLFNKIQRLTFYKIKNYYTQNGKITQKDKSIIYAQLKEEFDLTSRAIDAILSNMLGRYESIKGLKEFGRKSLERKISILEKELTKLKDVRTLQRIYLKNGSKNFNFIKYKNLKIKIYWKQKARNETQRIHLLFLWLCCWPGSKCSIKLARPSLKLFYWRLVRSLKINFIFLMS